MHANSFMVLKTQVVFSLLATVSHVLSRQNGLVLQPKVALWSAVPPWVFAEPQL